MSRRRRALFSRRPRRDRPTPPCSTPKPCAYQVTEIPVESSLADRVAGAPWYQALRLPGDIVTPGNFDTLDELERVPFPNSLAGKRCLDIGTADGFWAFEMERRGASEVLAVDLHDPARMDWPGLPKTLPEMESIMGRDLNKNRGFQIAHDALNSTVEWRELSVYELDPDVIGEFDFVFIGSLLLHLRDPVAALSAIRTLLRGELLSVDAISPLLTLTHPTQPVARFEAPGWPMWWAFNLTAYRRLFAAAGLEITESGRPFFLKRGPGYGATPRESRWFWSRFQVAAIARLGIPHAWVSACPAAARHE